MKKVNSKDLIDWWLDKFHNTNLEQAVLDNPHWLKAETDYTEMKKHLEDYTDEEATRIANNFHNCSREFYRTFAVTQEQYEEWEKWAKAYVKKETRCSKKHLEHDWPWIALQSGPSIIKTNNQEKDEKT